ncbi:unnamed protein product [Amoebophrya sp. A25]|nr:unnamed protein product [Amoebophrya sp. A25]|eukprot:GSA25T00014059001.1
MKFSMSFGQPKSAVTGKAAAPATGKAKPFSMGFGGSSSSTKPPAALTSGGAAASSSSGGTSTGGAANSLLPDIFKTINENAVAAAVGSSTTNTSSSKEDGASSPGGKTAVVEEKAGPIVMGAALPPSTKTATKGPSGTGGAASLFLDAMETEENQEQERIAQGYHPRIGITKENEARTQKQLDKLMAENAEIFQYDEHLDDEEMARKYNNLTRTDALEQVKRTGLTVMDKDYHAKLAAKKSQYVEGMKDMKERREVERAILEQRAINKEIKAEGGPEPEAFVTGAYARELERRKEFERKLLEQDNEDEAAFKRNSRAAWGFEGELHKNLLKQRQEMKESVVGLGPGDATASAGDSTTSSGEALMGGLPSAGPIGPPRPPGVVASLGPERPPAVEGVDVVAAKRRKIDDEVDPAPADASSDLAQAQPAAGPSLPAAVPAEGEDTSPSALAAVGPALKPPSPKLAPIHMPTPEESLAQRKKEEEQKRVKAAEEERVRAIEEAKKKEDQEKQKAERQSRAMGAKERYLMRKQAAAAKKSEEQEGGGGAAAPGTGGGE